MRNLKRSYVTLKQVSKKGDREDKQIEEENELYLEEYGEKFKVSGGFKGIYTICDVHRKIYRMLIDEPEKLSNADKQEELKYYLQRAYTIAKKTDAKLRQYKHNYDDKWYEHEKTKYEEWLNELETKKNV